MYLKIGELAWPRWHDEWWYTYNSKYYNLFGVIFLFTYFLDLSYFLDLFIERFGLVAGSSTNIKFQFEWLTGFIFVPNFILPKYSVVSNLTTSYRQIIIQEGYTLFYYPTVQMEGNVICFWNEVILVRLDHEYDIEDIHQATHFFHKKHIKSI